jgi:hypothetical protein
MIDLLIRTLRRAYMDQPQVARVSAELCRFRTLDPAIGQRVLDVMVAQRGAMCVDDHSVISRGALASRPLRASEIDHHTQAGTVTLRIKPDRRTTIAAVSVDRRHGA